MDDKRVRPGIGAAVLGLMAALAVLVFLMESRRPPGRVPREGTEVAREAADESRASPAAAPAPGRHDSRPSPTPSAATGEPVPYIEGLVFGDIDLREAKELMPDNVYWQMGAPTKDAAVLEAREQERIRRNDEYGKVLSGDASEDEVKAYYDYRRRVSADLLEFADFMNRRFRNSLSDEFRGMLDLSIKLHTARLAQISGELETALARAREHAKIREDWQREQKEFEAPSAGH